MLARKIQIDRRMIYIYRYRQYCICIRESVYQRIYVRKFAQKLESGLLLSSGSFEHQFWLLSRSLKIGVNFAFVLTSKSAVKSCRQTSQTISTITISLVYPFIYLRLRMSVEPDCSDTRTLASPTDYTNKCSDIREHQSVTSRPFRK